MDYCLGVQIGLFPNLEKSKFEEWDLSGCDDQGEGFVGVLVMLMLVIVFKVEFLDV